uniref:Uncharacterized protein n=1 Tax=Oryzias latipes TaxID=8090 RepID=A0A3P9L999_ORYLA
MRVGAAALAGGMFGVVGTLCFFLAFGTDYWLVASDDCGSYTSQSPTVDNDANKTETASEEAVTASPSSLTLLHEGFFWRCAFQMEPSAHAVLTTFLTNQPKSKLCVHGYLFPLPVALGPIPHPNYDATAVFRGFWTVLVILGLVSALTGGFLLVCGVPFISHKLYKLGGAFLISAGKFKDSNMFLWSVCSVKQAAAGNMNVWPKTCAAAVASVSCSRRSHHETQMLLCREDLPSSIQTSFSLFLDSLLVPLHAPAVRSVDGGGGRGPLHPAGEGRVVSTRRGFSALRSLLHGGGSRRPSGARLWVGVHAGGPSAEWQQMSHSCSQRESRPSFLLPALELATHLQDVKFLSK